MLLLLLQSALLSSLHGTAQTAVTNSKDFQLNDVTCKDTEECIPISKCESARDAIDNRHVHHGYERCGWYGSEEIVCCPKDPGPITLRLKVTKAKDACNNYTESKFTTVKGQILGGGPASAGEFPHMAALGYSRNGSAVLWGHCGGSLISFDYVLTAAHCLSFVDFVDDVQIDLEVVEVRLGKVDRVGDTDDLIPQDIRVAEKLTFPQYNPETKRNDIALLRLEREATLNQYVSPACLYLNPEDPVKYITVAGWGNTTPKGNQSQILQKTQLKAFDIISCSDIRRNPLSKEILDTQMCAISYDNKTRDTCPGDSGGPAQITDGGALYVVGVTSYGICGVEPGVYTRVARFVPWIEREVWK